MKKTRRSEAVVFKPYRQGQLQLPTDLSELIPEKHVVRVVDAAIERVDLRRLVSRYKGGGTSSYHPKMMLKVLVYAYTQRVYSSRQIAKALRENVYFMWLSGNSRPDFRTVNRFRGEVMKGILGDVFGSVLELLVEGGYVQLEQYYVDGTKLEANANRYGWVCLPWRPGQGAKSTRRYKGRLQEKVKALLEEIERVNEAEDEAYGERDLEELGETSELASEKLERKMGELNERLAGEAKNKKLARAVKKLKTDYLPRLEKYEEQERKLGGRSSYAKSDPEATFMRMKEGGFGRASLRPAYNVQVGTEGQFVVGYSVHQRPGDPGCLIPHLEQLKGQLGCLSAKVIADAAYGSEENYAYLEREGVGNYVKYRDFGREQHPRRGAPAPEAFHYEKSTDTFICAAGRQLKYACTKRHTSENGYRSQRRHYMCHNCGGCRYRASCAPGAANRSLQVSFALERMKQRVRENLLSPEGTILRGRRRIEVESVFGRWKHDWGFRRFMLRGKEKVSIELGLLSLAHNLSKLAC
jgi:transposase